MASNSFEITTIKVEQQTKLRLDKLRTHPRESYNEVISTILNLVNSLKINPGLAKKQLEELERIKRTLQGK